MGDVVKHNFAPADRENEANRKRERIEVLFEHFYDGDKIKKSTPRLKNREDQRAVAEELWKILEEAEEDGIPKEAILNFANIGSVNFRKKHLSQYSLNPELDTIKKNKQRLTQTTAPYIKIADSALRLRKGTDPTRAEKGEQLFRLFGTSSLANPSQGNVEAPEYAHLSGTLNNVAQAIAVKHRLKEMFQAIARVQPALGNWDEPSDLNSKRRQPDQIDLEFALIGSPLNWPIEFYSESSDVSDQDDCGGVPPYPTLILGQWEVGPSFPMRIEQTKSDLAPLPAGLVTQATYEVEIRLCIIPTGADMYPQAALRLQLKLNLEPISALNPGDAGSGDEQIKFPNELLYLPSDRPGLIGGATHGCRNFEFQCDIESIPALVQKYFPINGSPNRYSFCRFLPIRPSICRDWFQFDTVLERWSPPRYDDHLNVLGPAAFSDFAQTGISDLPRHSIAAALDCCLSSQDTPDIVGWLDERAGRLVKLFGDLDQQTQRVRRAGYDDLTARLRAMRGE